MRNIKLTLEYDGSDFAGWQIQPGLRTVQGEVESALALLTQEKISITSAGRTDSGVHALGQVANFYTNSDRTLQVFIDGGNALLPRDVRIRHAEEVDEAFSARYNATRRHYRYVISTRQHAIGRQYAWYLPMELDLDAIKRATDYLQGDLDFTSFCQAGAVLQHFRCQIFKADWLTTEDKLIFEIVANRFVHNMVRILVGTFVDIGRGTYAPDAMATILAGRDRRLAGRTAPPHGLFLVSVSYDGSRELNQVNG